MDSASGSSAYLIAVTSPGNPAPEPRSSHRRASGTASETCSESAKCLTQRSSEGRFADEIDRALPFFEEICVNLQTPQRLLRQVREERVGGADRGEALCPRGSSRFAIRRGEVSRPEGSARRASSLRFARPVPWCAAGPFRAARGFRWRVRAEPHNRSSPGSPAPRRGGRLRCPWSGGRDRPHIWRRFRSARRFLVRLYRAPARSPSGFRWTAPARPGDRKRSGGYRPD